MGELVGVLPGIGTGALEAFAFGILLSGICFLALATPRHSRKREATARYDIPSRPGPDTRPLPTVPSAKSAGAPEVIRTARTEQIRPGTDRRPRGSALPARPGRPGARAAAAGRDRWVAEAWLALKEQAPAPGDARPADGAGRASGHSGDALPRRSAGPSAAEHEAPAAGSAAGAQRPHGPAAARPAELEPRRAAAPAGADSPGDTGEVTPRNGTHRAPHPLGDPTFGTEGSQAQDARRQPRHAAPAPALGSKMTNLFLFSARSLADGSRN